MNKNEWIEQKQLEVFERQGTTAHRLCTIDNGWAERFGADVLISFRAETARDRLLSDLQTWVKSVDFGIGRIFGRFQPKKNEERETPRLLSEDKTASLRTVVTENGLKFGIDFAAGYSVGLFIDQRENRRFVRQLKPKRVLNCFAYTCSFSIAAASIGAKTLNVDLSRRSLERGRENFALNQLSADGHQFLADDVRPVMRRLARRGNKFDMIILDPPTFSRTKGGAAFHVEKDLEELISAVVEIADRGANILVSTNCESLNESALERMARYALKLSRRSGGFHREPSPADFPPGDGAKTVWLTLH